MCVSVFFLLIPIASIIIVQCIKENWWTEFKFRASQLRSLSHKLSIFSLATITRYQSRNKSMKKVTRNHYISQEPMAIHKQ